MPITHTRRRFLATMTLAGLIRPPPATAGEGLLETTSVRLSNSRVICIAPQYVAEDLLRAEGFTDIRYVDNPRPGSPEATARGELDFSLNTAWDLLTKIDAGERTTLLAGVMVGCYELFGNEGIHGIIDLKGKSIGAKPRARPGSGSQPSWLLLSGSTPLGTSTGSPTLLLNRSSCSCGQDRCVSGLPARARGSACPAYRPRDRQYRRGSPL